GQVGIAPRGGRAKRPGRRTSHEGHRAIEQLLLAIGETAGLLLGEVAQAKEGDHTIGVAGKTGIGRAEQPADPRALVLLRSKNEVLAHGELGEHLKELEGAAYAEAIEPGGAQVGNAPAVDAHVAARRGELAQDAVED